MKSAKQTVHIPQISYCCFPVIEGKKEVVFQSFNFF